MRTKWPVILALAVSALLVGCGGGGGGGDSSGSGDGGGGGGTPPPIPPPVGVAPTIVDSAYYQTSASPFTVELRTHVNPNDLATTVHFEWGLYSGGSFQFQSTPQVIPAGSADVYVTATATSLAWDKYIFQVVATNAAGTSTFYGGDFVTKIAGAPAVSAPTVGWSGNQMRFAARVTPNGMATSFYFVYWIQDVFGTRGPQYTTAVQFIAPPNDWVERSVSSEWVTSPYTLPLPAGWSWRVETVAWNSGGSSNSAPVSF